MKKLPVEVDVLEYLVKLGLVPGAFELVKATGDLSLIAIYYLLRVGEYTTRGSRNESKQTVQYCMRDVVLFGLDSYGKLKQLPQNAPHEEIIPIEVFGITHNTLVYMSLASFILHIYLAVYPSRLRGVEAYKPRSSTAYLTDI
jgi:hypothetical protein